LSEHRDRASYDPAFYTRLIEVEDDHFWFRSRNKIIAALVGPLSGRLMPGYRILEVGCGTGNVLRTLENVCVDGIVVGMDLYAEGLNFARLRTAVDLVQGDMSSPPFTAAFDMVGVFDVLEHVPDDSAVLQTLRHMLTPQGILLLTVPAHPSLWSYFDDASHHCRRYRAGELSRKLTDAGYVVEYLSYYMSLLLPFMWIARKSASMLKKKTPEEREALAARDLRVARHGRLNRTLTRILEYELRLVAGRRSLPIGTSLIAIARNARSCPGPTA
jgi:SAM-dependent methyltransferase